MVTATALVAGATGGLGWALTPTFRRTGRKVMATVSNIEQHLGVANLVLARDT